MKRPALYRFAFVLLALCVSFVVWQGSFRLKQFDPSNPTQTFIFWAISILIFALMVTLGWVLVRTGLKLYIERQANQAGSRIKTKLVAGALALSIVPVCFLVWFSYSVLNVNMQAWFTDPAVKTLKIFDNVGRQLGKEMQDETSAQAALLAGMPQVRASIEKGEPFAGGFRSDSAANRSRPRRPSMTSPGTRRWTPGGRSNPSPGSERPPVAPPAAGRSSPAHGIPSRRAR